MNDEKSISNGQFTDLKENLKTEQFKTFSQSIFSLKAISIILIILYHIGYWFRDLRSYNNQFIRLVFDFGNIGVDLFVFLSGMLLIFNILYRNKENISWIEWYKRRIIRIFPALWIMLFTIIVFYAFVLNSQFGLDVLLINLSGLQGIPIINPHFSSIHFIYWFITLILSCYLLFPLIFIAIKKNFKISFYVGCILFILFILIYDFFYFSVINLANFVFKIEINEIFLQYYIPRYFGFYFGTLFGYWIGKDRAKNLGFLFEKKVGVTSLIFLMITFGIYSIIHMIERHHVGAKYYERFIIFPLITIFFIIFFIYFFNTWLKTNKYLIFLGKNSFELYLSHHIINIIIRFIFFTLFSIPETLYFYLLLITPIFLIITPCFAYILNYTIVFLTDKKQYHKYIIIFALSLFVNTFIAMFLNFEFDILLTLVIYSPILLILILIYLRRQNEIDIPA